MTPAVSPGIVVVDKPAGMTSHDVVGRCRRLFGTRKVGHAGTLDPMATGVLVVGIERATKILGLLTASDKSYEATLRLGQTTTTEDADGELLLSISAAGLDDAQIDAACVPLRGDIMQVPSAVSAIKIAGKRAYQRVREGEAVKIPARPVRVPRFDVTAVRRNGDVVDLDVAVDCSSGTYVRALARDLGNALGVGAHLTALRRTAVGRFGLAQARTLDQLAEAPRVSYSLDEACLQGFPRRPLSAEEADDASHGRPLSPAAIPGTYAAVAPDGRVMALLADGGSHTRSVVVIRPATLER